VSEVYFIACEGRIKIGLSRNADSRVKELATAAPAKLTFLARVHGGRELETALHRRLRDHRVSGEWFRDCDEVRGVMQEVVDGRFKPRTDFKYPELIEALKRISGPHQIGTRMKTAVNIAACRTGLPRWRTFDIWYGKARRVTSKEALAIRDALLREIAR
jgi:hypothetical protein